MSTHKRVVITQSERENLYNQTQIKVGDRVKLLRHDDLVIRNPDGSVYMRGAEWRSATMDQLVGLVREVDGIYDVGGFKFLGLKGLVQTWRAASALLQDRDEDVQSVDVLNTPMPTINPPANCEPELKKYYGWLPRELTLTIGQFKQRYVNIKLLPGDRVVILPHPMLLILGLSKLKMPHRLGNFAKSHDEEGMAEWFGREVTVNDVSYSHYVIDGESFHFLRFESEEINQAFERTRYFRAGDCVVTKAVDGRKLPQPDQPHDSIKTAPAACLEEQAEPSLGELLFKDSAAREKREQEAAEARANHTPLPTLKCDPKFILAKQDLGRLARIREYQEEHAAYLHKAALVEQQMIEFGMAGHLPEQLVDPKAVRVRRRMEGK